MSAHIDYQTIFDGSTPRYAVMSFDDFQAPAGREASGADPTIPHVVVSATVDGASPLRAWREHLGWQTTTSVRRRPGGLKI